MRIYLVRHGETTGDIEDRYGGEYDDSLSDKGIAQAKELAGKLRGKGIQIIFCSPKKRAVETAGIVNEILNVKLEVVSALRERNYGVLTGLVKKEARKMYPKEVEKLEKNELHHNITDSEDYDSFRERVTGAFRKITSKTEYKRIAIVFHAGPIKCIAREIIRAGELELGDCAVLEVEKEKDKFRLARLDNARSKK